MNKDIGTEVEEKNKVVFKGTISPANPITSSLMDKLFGATEQREEARSWGIKPKGGEDGV